MSSNHVVINGISWDLGLLSDSSEVIKHFNIATFKKIKKLPLANKEILFDDDYWDFSSLDTLSTTKSFLTYDFSQINYNYKDIVKGMVLNYIFIDSKAFSTIKEKFRKINLIIDYLLQRHILKYKFISLRIVQDYYEQLNNSMREEVKQEYKRVLKELLSFIYLNDKSCNFTRAYEYLSERTSEEILKAEREDGKTPNIPKEFLNQMISCAVADIGNEKIDKKEKFEACIILLLSQIGMRVGELRLFEAGRKIPERIFDDEKEVNYLNFKTFKTIEGGSFIWTKSILNSLSLIAYDCLEQITKDDREKYNTTYLLFSHRSGKINPISPATIRHHILKFVARHRTSINCVNRMPSEVEGFYIANVKETRDGQKFLSLSLIDGLRDSDTICCPCPHQFRVAVTTDLFEKGVEFGWIKEHMNHLSGDMTKHYIRFNEQSEKEKEVAKSIIKDIVTKEVRLIGKDKENLTAKINEFVLKNGFNVATNLNEIIEGLANLLPIRVKPDGYCIKSAFGRKCALDGVTDELYCTYGLCSNHFVTYEMVDITYEGCVNLRKIIQHNKKNGFNVEAQRESNKLKRVIQESLVPELNELMYEIDRQGGNILLQKHINLSHIINNVEKVLDEVKEWENQLIT
ncbi:MAG: hypothetical protein ACM3X7_01245 [Solirubrobacterales bacterium]